jgi:hypothetical protein
MAQDFDSHLKMSSGRKAHTMKFRIRTSCVIYFGIKEICHALVKFLEQVSTPSWLSVRESCGLLCGLPLNFVNSGRTNFHGHLKTCQTVVKIRHVRSYVRKTGSVTAYRNISLNCRRQFYLFKMFPKFW